MRRAHTQKKKNKHTHTHTHTQKLESYGLINIHQKDCQSKLVLVIPPPQRKKKKKKGKEKHAHLLKVQHNFFSFFLNSALLKAGNNRHVKSKFMTMKFSYIKMLKEFFILNL